MTTKCSLLAAVIASAVRFEVVSGVELEALPIQTFFVPMAETNLFYDMFIDINEKKAEAPIETSISVSCSTDGTVIWWDHQEDGYEADVANPTSSTTEVWGDGDASNGCAPDIDVCDDDHDILNAGANIVIQNTIALPRDVSDIKYDGGDKLQASFPITMTRGAYPQEPGSLMAGATEVTDTLSWGQSYIAPVGESIGESFAAFQFAAFFYTAAHDDTRITLPDGTEVVLNEGESGSVHVDQNDKLEADKNIQVHFITGDKMSYYELRWYSLLPTTDWTTSYLSPVGDTYGKTKMLIYNPGPDKIEIKWDYLVNGVKTTSSKTVKPNRAKLTDVIPTDSGALVYSTGKFIPLSLTDTEFRTSEGQATASQWYDWGFPVMPVDMLTPQVLVGWGYGCTDNRCMGLEDRSVVWITPIEDADIYIDYDNSGDNYSVFPAAALSSSKFTDSADQDMSGAIIFATQTGSGPEGSPVDIAAAWGQDPSRSKAMQSISLDLGTVTLPFPAVRVKKFVDKAEAAYGEVLTYTIKVINIGQTILPGLSLTLADTIDEVVSYIPDTTTYSVAGASDIVTRSVSDSNSGTVFPLDDAGYVIPFDLARRGGEVEISFQVLIDGVVSGDTVVNTGFIQQGSTTTPFDASTHITFVPNVTIENEVYLGADNGALCSTDLPEEHVEDITGVDVTYCFNVTNNGDTLLTDLLVTNDDISFTDTIPSLLPGESVMVYHTSVISMDLVNMANVTATPSYANGTAIDDEKVSDGDDSEVSALAPIPAITIANTVYLGSDDGDSCATDLAGELAQGNVDSDVVYCFNVTNTGNTHLESVTITNGELNLTDNSIGNLAPGESVMVAVSSTITAPLTNNAVVTANPVYQSGKDIPDTDDVTDTDPSAVDTFNDGDVRMGEIYRPPDEEPPTPDSCLQNSFNDDSAGVEDLVCTTNDVFLDTLTSDETKSCVAGESVVITVDASIHVTKSLFDMGWYVATDGGDALEGTCVVNGLQERATYTVVDAPGSSNVVGSVAWDGDAQGGNDVCGDVSFDGTEGGNIDIPIIVELPVPCTDENEDGNLDISVCFTWRTDATDGACTLERTDVNTVGTLADMYPGETSGCYCERYDIANVKVTPPTDAVLPC